MDSSSKTFFSNQNRDDILRNGIFASSCRPPHSLVLQRFCLYLTTFRGKVCIREQWHDMQKYVIRVARVSAYTVAVRVRTCVHVGVRRCMRIWKSQWQPYQNGGPRGGSGKKRRATDQPRPEYRMSGIFISRCHSWKLASIFEKILL